MLRLFALVCLYFAQGLPFGFFSHAVPVLLNRDQPAEIVGLSSMLAIPWALKFLWAPWIERVEPGQRLGRRKKVILPAQALLVVLLVGLGQLRVDTGALAPLLVGFFLVSLLSATQDIATDALTIDLLPPEDRGRGGAIQTGAYRMGMMAGGGGVLALADRLGYREGFWLMAFLVALSSLPLWFVREPEAAPGPRPSSRAPAGLSLLWGFLRHAGTLRLLLLIFAFKIGDALCAGMVTRWFVKQGLSTSDIALSRGLVGGAASVLGAVLGAYAVRALGRRQSLITSAGVQAVAILMYLLLALAFPLATPMPLWGFYAASIGEHLAGGAATAVLFTFMMDNCRSETPATDYTAQASALVLVIGLGMVGSGLITGQVGLLGLFAVAALLGALSPFAVARLST